MAWLRVLVSVALVQALSACAAPPPAPEAGGRAVALPVVGDAVPMPLAEDGDAMRGRALVVTRETANCVLCHALPDPAVRFAGDVGPSLAGVGTRLSVGQLRLRVADSLRLNPATVMPSYYRTAGLDRVAAAYRGRTILSAQEIEDIVAYLATLR